MSYDKNLEKLWKSALSKGECIYGCKMNKTGCQHLDSYLEHGYVKNKKSVGAVNFGDKIENIPPSDSAANSKYNVFKLLKVFRKAGVTAAEGGIVLDKFYRKLNFAQIAKARGYLSNKIVYDIYHRAVKRILYVYTRKR